MCGPIRARVFRFPFYLVRWRRPGMVLKMTYRFERGLENVERMTFSGAGKYNLPIVPKLEVSEYEASFEAPFNYFRSIRGAEARSRYLLHFFVDDYQFKRVWERPDYYLPGLKEYKYVVMPDFSTYIDLPLPIQLYNYYRNHWLAAYWGMNGVRIIPQIMYGLPFTYDFCFDGMPIGGVQVVSSYGLNKDKEAIENWVQGFNEAIKRLQPELVLLYGKAYDGMAECNIHSLTPFTDELESRCING